jgi:putative methyltransferase (TIGR04325 family)
MEYVAEGWGYTKTHPEVKGWQVPEIVETYARKWPAFVAATEGTGPLGISHDSEVVTNTSSSSHNMVMAFGYVLALAAHRLDTLSMLDWGGGIGHYYALARALLPGVTIDYHCKDLPAIAEHGARLSPDQRFHGDDSCLERSYDLVMASGSLHCSERWRETLHRLAQATRGYLYVTRVPTILRGRSFVMVQRPYRHGYNTEYLLWCLNRAELVGAAEAAGLRLAREFIIGGRFEIAGAPEDAWDRGYLFRPLARS